MLNREEILGHSIAFSYIEHYTTTYVKGSDQEKCETYDNWSTVL